jgi:hypothetical protein
MSEMYGTARTGWAISWVAQFKTFVAHLFKTVVQCSFRLRETQWQVILHADNMFVPE